MKLVELFYQGGPLMWPLLGLAALGVAAILERTFYFTRLGGSRRFGSYLQQALLDKSLQFARDISKRYNSPQAAVARVYLDNLHREADLRLELVKVEGQQQLQKVEARLRLLGLIAHVAPLVGLLGTVTGMVEAFQSISQLSGAVRPSDLADGIWVALLTTVAGLVVSIPCMIAFHYFEGKADVIAKDMQATVVKLDDLCGLCSKAQIDDFAGNSPNDEQLNCVS